ncbi:MAG: dihydrodipicolinate synthase family protein [Lentisphaeria bacterium]
MGFKVFSATITPLLSDGRLDREGLARIYTRNLRHGVSGFFILGSMGEWGSFSDSFKEELVAESSRLVANQSELLVGINATSLPLSLDNMRRYQKYAFDSYVFMLPGATSALDPVKSILQVLDSADRPVYYYHCPPNNNKNLSLDQFAAIMAHPRLKGIKNSASNMWLRRELLLLKKERGFSTLLCEGQEWAVDEALFAGCDGMVCGMGALGSKFMVGIARAVEAGNYAEAVHLQNRFIELFHGVYGIDLSTVWNGQKYALCKLGLISSPLTLAQDMSVLTESRKAQIDDCVERMKEELD